MHNIKRTVNSEWQALYDNTELFQQCSVHVCVCACEGFCLTVNALLDLED